MVKKVLHIGARLGIEGGIEKYFIGLYKNIDKSKYRIDIALVDEGKEQYYESYLRENGSLIYYIPRRDKYFFKSITMRFSIYRQYKRGIVHIHVSRGLRVLDGIIARLCGVKIVIYHSMTNHPKVLLRHRITLPLFLLSGSYFIGCTKMAGQYFFGKNIVYSKKFSVEKSAIECSQYKFDITKRRIIRSMYNVGDELCIGFVGRMAYEKNILFIIDILYELIKMDFNAKLLLVGNGQQMQIIKSKVKLLNIVDKVIFTGVQKDVAGIMCAIDVLLLPSEFEGLGMVLVEAQTAGVYCFASTNVPEDSNVAGLVTFVSLHKKALEWANKIKKIKGLPRVEEAYNKVLLSGYEIKDAALKIEKVYDSLI